LIHFVEHFTRIGRFVKSCVKVQAGSDSFLKCIDRTTA
jgi:hypothetical protein